MLGGSASGGSLRWNDPDRFHGYDLSRVSAAPQAVEPMMGIPSPLHKGACGASAVRGSVGSQAESVAWWRSSREQTMPTAITTAAPTKMLGSGPPWAKP